MKPRRPRTFEPERKLYTVKLETELVVLAENEKEAELIAVRETRADHLYVVETCAMTSIPDGWETADAPFLLLPGEMTNRTIQEWIDVGAAPEYAALMAKLKAR